MTLELPTWTSRPFTRAQATERGLTTAAMRPTHVREALPGVYVAKEKVISRRLRIEAGLTRLEGRQAWVSHHSAAVLHDLPVPTDTRVHLSVPRGSSRSRARGLLVHDGAVEPQLVQVADLPTTAPAHLFVEMANWVPALDLVVLGDALVRRPGISPRTLSALAAAARGKGSRRAREAVTHVRRGVDSPPETRLRMLLTSAGLPEPAVGHVVRDDDGRVVARFDLWYPDLGLAVEYDGRQHAETTAQWIRDIERREWMDNRHIRLVVVTAEGLYRDPAGTLARVREAMLQRGRRVGVTDGWRLHFAG